MMDRSRALWIVAVVVAALLVTSGSALAQIQTIEIKNGEVMAVSGDFVTVRGPEGVKQFHIPADFRFNMNGKQLSVYDLRPGMKLTAVIKTTETPVDMTTTEVRSAEVVHTSNTVVVLKGEDGKHRKFTAKELREKGIIVYRDGEQVAIQDLRKGDKLTATIVTEVPPVIMTETEFEVFAQAAPAPPTRTAQTRRPRQPKKTPVTLPKTAGPLPLIGLGGVVFVGIGLGMTLVRRFRR
jgi:hypothetical protein